MANTPNWPDVYNAVEPIAAAVAAELDKAGVEGGGWLHQTHDVAYASFSLEHRDGWAVHLTNHHSYRKGAAGRRFSVSGRYPQGHYGRTAEEISVGMSRPPAGIAADIARRFLPEYVPLAVAALEQHAKELEADRKRAEFNRAAVRTLPALSGGYESSPGRRRSYFHSGPGYGSKPRPAALASGQVDVSHAAESVDLELRDVPSELALRILAMLDARPAISGHVTQQIAPRRAELPEAVPTVQGTVLARALTDEHARAALPLQPEQRQTTYPR